LLFAILFCGLASAQTSAYGFWGPGKMLGGGNSAFDIDFGGGAKYVDKSGFGVGAELSAAGPQNNFSNADFGLLALNGYYDIKPEHKLVPYLTGGYARSFGHELGSSPSIVNYGNIAGGENFGSIGGGFNYWFSKKFGVLGEFRDYLHHHAGVTGQIWMVKMGVSFR